MKMYAGMGMNIGDMALPEQFTLILNTNSELINKLGYECENNTEKAELLAAEIYRLALLAQRRFTADELKVFLADTYKLLERL